MNKCVHSSMIAPAQQVYCKNYYILIYFFQTIFTAIITYVSEGLLQVLGRET